MKAVFSSLMAALVLVALLAGNCLSCPQMLLALATHQAPHSCCHHKQPVKVECQSQALGHFVKTEQGAQALDLAVTADRVTVVAAAMASQAHIVTIPAEHAPPDLLSLHSSFRI
jgi:hypothetical protein